MRTSCRRIAGAFAMLTACSSVQAGTLDAAQTLDNGFLGIFSDSAGTQACATVAPGTMQTLYLYAFPNGPIASGVSGVEFRIVATQPAGYMFSYVPPAGPGLAFGDPMDVTPDDDLNPAGLNFAYGYCPPGPRVPFGTLRVINLGNGGPCELRVQRRDPASNPLWDCPLFTQCGPPFEKFCMRSCAVDEFGSAVAARLQLNSPDCTSGAPCPAACAGAPAVALSAPAWVPGCVGAPVTVTATARNTGATTADIDVFIEHALAGSFADVLPGQSVLASRTYTLMTCRGESVDIGAVARNTACPGQPTGAEVVSNPLCTNCGQNLPPDCSQAFTSVTTLWPPDGRLVPVQIGGVTDPEGGPLAYELQFIAEDESPGYAGSPTCPDAFIDGPTSIRLRAERDNHGDGRRYLVKVRAADARGAECNSSLTVCVPRKAGESCVSGSIRYLATICETPPLGTGGPVLATRASVAGSIDVIVSQSGGTETRVEVYDIRGRRVAQLARGRFGPGSHVLHWDGSDTAGHTVAAGVYIIRMQSAELTLSTKAVLVR